MTAEPDGPALLVLLVAALSRALGGQQGEVNDLQLHWTPATGAQITIQVEDSASRTV